MKLKYFTKGTYFMEDNQKIFFYEIDFNKFLIGSGINNFQHYFDFLIEKVPCDLDPTITELFKIEVNVMGEKTDGICGLFRNDLAILDLNIALEIDFMKKFHLNLTYEEIKAKFCKVSKNYLKFKNQYLQKICKSRLN